MDRDGVPAEDREKIVIHESQLRFASKDVISRAKKCRCFERGNQVYVLPQIPLKDDRIAIWVNEGILCISTDGEACPANDHGQYCYHVYAAARRRKINAKRRATIAAKKLKAA